MSELICLTDVEGLSTPRGPFSQGVTARGAFLFVAGQGPYLAAEDRFVRGTIAEQTSLTLEAVNCVLRKAGVDRTAVVSCRVYLQPLDPETFASMNAAYCEFFGAHRPARTTIGAQLLGIDVEIDCVALLP